MPSGVDPNESLDSFELKDNESSTVRFTPSVPRKYVLLLRRLAKALGYPRADTKFLNTWLARTLDRALEEGLIPPETNTESNPDITDEDLEYIKTFKQLLLKFTDILNTNSEIESKLKDFVNGEVPNQYYKVLIAFVLNNNKIFISLNKIDSLLLNTEEASLDTLG